MTSENKSLAIVVWTFIFIVTIWSALEYMGKNGYSFNPQQGMETLHITGHSN